MDNGEKLPIIKFLSGPLAEKTFVISKPVTTLGRDPTNDIVIVNDQKVSRHHARLYRQGNQWTIENLSQRSNLTVNRQSTQQAIIGDRTVIGLGEDTSFIFLAMGDSPAQQPGAPDGTLMVGPQSAGSGSALQRASNAGAAWAASNERVPPAFPPPQTLEPQRFATPQQGFPPSTPQQGFPPPPTQQAFPAPPPVFSSTSSLQNARVEAGDRTLIAESGSLGLPSFTITSNAHGDKRAFVLDKPIINIGRDATNEIVINDRIISGLHLRVVRRGNSFVLMHPNPDNPRQATLNGLLYQGRKVRGDEQFSKPLENGDIFRIGDENGTLITLTYSDGSGTVQDTLPPVKPFRLTENEITIGRAADNRVVLSHPQVSTHHARLVREGGTYRILDLNSTNHVYVNSELATSYLLKLGDEIRIGPYRLIYDGNQLTQYDESSFIRIDAQNLKKTGNNNVILLNNISVVVPPRKFVALVGGSGAGKSTLMDALNGLRPAHEGKVLYNGQDYYRNIAAFSTQLGYVPQDDIVHRDLTVERALYYAAKLRLPGDFTDEQIEQRIKEVLEDVEMTSRRKLLVKKLSGGQRKRVSIALELLANPSVFFLDEPTSGLDPGLDRKMMYLLRKLADKGHTIVLVTHATNNINNCDYVCFLAQGGRLAYFGPPDQAKSYFEKNDFAEIYTSLEPTDQNPNVAEEAEAKYKLSREYQQYIAGPLRETANITRAGLNGQPRVSKRVKRGNPFKQFALLSRRNFELLRNDRSTLILLLLQAPLLALLLILLIRLEVGTGVFDATKVVQCAPRITTSSAVSATNQAGFLGLNSSVGNAPVDCFSVAKFLETNSSGIAYAQSNGGVIKALQNFLTTSNGGLDAERALFIIAFIAVLFGVINGTREIVKEASIYRRERAVNLGIAPYVFSKVLVLSLFAVYQSAVLLFIVDLFEPFHQGIFLPVLLEIYITLLLTAFVGLMLGLTASAFSPNEDTANSLLPFILIPQVVFAGVEIPLKEWVLQIASMIFPTRWSMVALGSSIGLHSDKLGGDALYDSNSTFHGTLFSTFSQTDAIHRLLLAWGALGALIVALIILVCLGLKRKDSRS